MSHELRYLEFPCRYTPGMIKKRLSFAYDPMESSGYHGNITFHPEIVCKTYGEAMIMLAKLDRGHYDDHAVKYRDGRRVWWLVKVEWHC